MSGRSGATERDGDGQNGCWRAFSSFGCLHRCGYAGVGEIIDAPRAGEPGNYRKPTLRYVSVPWGGSPTPFRTVEAEVTPLQMKMADFEKQIVDPRHHNWRLVCGGWRCEVQSSGRTLQWRRWVAAPRSGPTRQGR